VLATVLAISAILGGNLANVINVIADDVEMHTDNQESTVTESFVTTNNNGRQSDLKFVSVIKNSTMWTDIKRRTLTIKEAQPQLVELADKSPADLTDQELAQLKKTCLNGLKCVAVDKLLILKKVTQIAPDGNTTILMAITKITKVLTKFTTEYHQEKNFTYTETNESYQLDEVYESITKTVEKYKELCQINPDFPNDERKSNDNLSLNVDTANLKDNIQNTTAYVGTTQETNKDNGIVQYEKTYPVIEAVPVNNADPVNEAVKIDEAVQVNNAVPNTVTYNDSSKVLANNGVIKNGVNKEFNNNGDVLDQNYKSEIKGDNGFINQGTYNEPVNYGTNKNFTGSNIFVINNLDVNKVLVDANYLYNILYNTIGANAININ